eukprot:scaffold195074_cov32-Tisochrysis_lutea.AAC.1
MWASCVRLATGISSSSKVKGSGIEKSRVKLQLQCRSETQIRSSGRPSTAATDIAEASARSRLPSPFFASTITNLVSASRSSFSAFTHPGSMCVTAALELGGVGSPCGEAPPSESMSTSDTSCTSTTHMISSKSSRRTIVMPATEGRCEPTDEAVVAIGLSAAKAHHRSIAAARSNRQQWGRRGRRGREAGARGRERRATRGERGERATAEEEREGALILGLQERRREEIMLP